MAWSQNAANAIFTVENASTIGAALPNVTTTLAMWVYPTTTGIHKNLIVVSDRATDYNGGFGLWADTFLNPDAVTARTYNTTGGENSTANTGAYLAANTWNLVVGTCLTKGGETLISNSRWGYLWNGTTLYTSAETTAEKTHATWKAFRVGADSAAWYIAHAAVWDRVLTSSEVAELQTKLPTAVAASDLVFYWPLTASGTQTDTINSLTISHGGGASWVDEPTAPALPSLTGGASAVEPIVMKWRM